MIVVEDVKEMNELGKWAARLDILYVVQICQSDMIIDFFPHLLLP